MIRRVYLVELRPGLPASEADAFVAVLRNTARHIPGMVHSEVYLEQSRHPFDLVWDHAFEDQAALQRYMVHPYHANLLDAFLSPESFASVTKHSMAVLWDAGRELVADDFPPAFASAQAILADYPTPDGGVVLVEHLDIAAESLREYTRLLHDVYLPIAEPNGVCLKAILQSVDPSGHCVVLWSIPSWKALASLRWSLLTGPLEKWQSSIQGLRTGGSRRSLVAVRGAASEAEIRPGATLLLDETTLSEESFEKAITEMRDRITRTPPPGARLVSWLRSPDQTGESDTTMIWEFDERRAGAVESVLSAVHGPGVATSAQLFEAMPPL